MSRLLAAIVGAAFAACLACIGLLVVAAFFMSLVR